MSTSTDISPMISTDRWAGALGPAGDKPVSMRIFGLVMLIGFGILGTLALLTYHKTHAPWRLGAAVIFLTIAIVLFLWSLVSPGTLPPVYRAWMAFGQGIGNVVSSVLLGVLYIVVVAPVGLLMRAMGSDPLTRRIERTAPSYWRTHDVRAAKDHFQHMS